MLSYKFCAKKSVKTKAVEFGILSPEEIRSMAVCEINNPLIYCRGMPMPNGVIDLRLGTCDRRLRCATCNQTVESCPGHCGFIDLGVPMFYGFTDTCLKVVRSVCYFCSALLGGDEEANASRDVLGKQRFYNVYNIARTKKCCPACAAPQPTYARTATGIRIDWPDSTDWEDEAEKLSVTSRIFTSVEAHSILANISDEHVRLLGFDCERNHPRFMIPDVLLVPPSSIRPAIMQSSGSRLRGQDDLTLKLNDINKRALDLKNLIQSLKWNTSEPMTNEISDRMSKLQIEIYSLILPPTSVKTTGSQHVSAPMKTLSTRLKGKEGRIRGNLMGKRVDHSARSVITPDSLCPVDAIGVPISIAKTLTTPETVCPYNIRRLHQRVLIGADDVTGAQSIVTKDGVIQLQMLDRKKREGIRLQFGDTIERFIQDGDHVIFNRQPSLHRIGFLGHRVRLVPGLTFRMNLSVTGPYNADFDGDEMNVHVCQGIAAKTEVENIMSVRHQVITPQSARPVMGTVQDSLIGAYLLTNQSCLLTRCEFMQLVVWISKPTKEITDVPPPAIEKPGPFWTGSQLFSMLLPAELRIDRMRPGDVLPTGVLIRDGFLLVGRMAKNMLGTGSGGIVDVMYRELGADKTIQYLSNEQRVMVPFLMMIGFSVSYRDAVITNDGRDKVAQHIEKVKTNVLEIVNADLPKALENMAEATVFSMLSKLLLQTGAIGKKYMLRNSAILDLVESGSKGNMLNISQITGVVGQQSVEGKRVFSEATTRTLTCFDFDDRSLAGHGFVERSYNTGLTPAEFFFHNMGGREGLVDTAVKTAHTGYLQRRMVKALEDLHNTYEHSIRNAQGQVVQFSYGLDAWDSIKVRHANVKAIEMTREQIRCVMCDAQPTDVQTREYERVIELVLQVRRNRFSIMRPSIDAHSLLPFSVDAILCKFGECSRSKTQDRRSFEDSVEAHVNALCNELSRLVHGRETCILAIRFGFSSKQLLRCGCRVERLGELFDVVRKACTQSIVTPGEAVGSIAAQSLGEPTTQVFCDLLRSPAPYVHASDSGTAPSS